METKLNPHFKTKYACFSPLTGINYVETLVISLCYLAINVSVPLRGLIMWKLTAFLLQSVPVAKVSVPLRGLIMWKPGAICASISNRDSILSFSPLTGINYVETGHNWLVVEKLGKVSVPLRGLIMWKRSPGSFIYLFYLVSVPLRGLIMWKPALPL